MRKILTLLLVASALASVQTGATVRLPGIIGNHMVLQRESDARLWGWTDPGKKVTISCSWDRRTYSARSDSDGAWELTVRTPSAGGPFEITISDGKPLILKDILIGEVWLCSGQSNMEMPLEGFEYGQYVEGAQDYIAGAGPDRPVRFAQLKLRYSVKSEDDCDVEWQTNDPAILPGISACAVYFADCLQRSLDAPVGIIISDWGASSIEAWMDKESLLKTKPDIDFSILDKEESFKDWPQQTPTVLFNAMVYPLRKYSVKGLVWYQGESNIGNYQEYPGLQKAFVELWRSAFQNPGMPFCYTQIAPFEYPYEVKRAAFLRESQAMCESQIDNSFMAVTIDLGEKNVIHPRKKREMASRLAWGALALGYGKKIEYQSPAYVSHEIDGSRVIVRVSHAKFGLHSSLPHGEFIPGFEVAGEDKHFYPAQVAFIHGPEEAIAVSSPEVPRPVAVRYCFKDYQPGFLYNNYGLPLAPFRTDDWTDAKGPVFWW